MRMHSRTLAMLAGLGLFGACAPVPASPPDAAPGTAPAGVSGSILHSSTPADGSVVRGPVDALVLRFSPPARLGEVTVTGSQSLPASEIKNGNLAFNVGKKGLLYHSTPH